MNKIKKNFNRISKLLISSIIFTFKTLIHMHLSFDSQMAVTVHLYINLLKKSKDETCFSLKGFSWYADLYN